MKLIPDAAVVRQYVGKAMSAAPRRWLAILAIAAASFAAAENPFTEYTDEELTQFAGDWQSLSTQERRDFFTEMRRRMTANGRQQAIPVGGVRRFGRIIRQPDGSVVRIEGVVRYRAPGGKAQQPGYGTGFEQRVAEQEPDAEKTPDSPNVIPVKKPHSG